MIHESAYKVESIRADHVRAVEQFIDGIRRKDMAGVPFAPDVVLRSPLTHPATTAASEAEFRAFLAAFFPTVPPSREARIHWHLVEGNQVVTLWEWEIGPPTTVIRILDHFEVVDGRITLVEPFFDPRPLLAFANPAEG